MNWHNLFRYDDGKLYWAIKRQGLRHARQVGTPNKGYLWIKSNLIPKQVGVHRVIWEMHYGEIPKGMVIDHIDRNPLNNKIENLRLATRSQNSMNAKGKGKRDLPKNVYIDFEYKGIKKYRAQVMVNGKYYRSGGFDTVEDAEAEAKKMRQKYHGEFSVKEGDQ